MIRTFLIPDSTKKVIVCGLADIEGYDVLDDKQGVLVSVSCSDDPSARPIAPFIRKLFLSFDDVDDAMQSERLQPMCRCQARQVAKLIAFWLSEPSIDVMCCQCRAGISRSAGIAAAIFDHLELTNPVVGCPKLIPNRYVIGLVCRAMRSLAKM